MSDQCWHDFAFPARRCKREAQWRSPPEMCVGIGASFVAAVRWCDEHKQKGDVLIEPMRQEPKP